MSKIQNYNLRSGIMDTTINPELFSTEQLKRWLSALNMPTTGTKTELAIRLNAVHVEIRGLSPPLEGEDLDQWPMESEGTPTMAQAAASGTRHHSNDAASENTIEGPSALVMACNEATANSSNAENNRENLEGVHVENVASGVTHQSNGALLEQLLQRLLRIEAHQRNNGMMAENTERLEAGEIDEGVNERAARINEKPSVSLTLAKEVLPDFSGESCAKKWIVQLKNVTEIYNLNNIYSRLLFICKMKANAQKWLHAEPSRIREPFATLCEQLIATFGDKTSKAEMRRLFEIRKWQVSETFAEYLEEKLALARDVHIDEDEMMDQVIDGIPDNSMRIQARLQNFANPRQMVHAFRGVRLASAMDNMQQKDRRMDIRCRNCNSRGHLYKECKKPKREAGSCFACGATDHWVAKCPLRKGAESNEANETNNSYRAS